MLKEEDKKREVTGRRDEEFGIDQCQKKFCCSQQVRGRTVSEKGRASRSRSLRRELRVHYERAHLF